MSEAQSGEHYMVVVAVVVCSSCGAKVVQRVEMDGGYAFLFMQVRHSV